MTLATKNLPGDLQSFEDFVERALNFDFCTDYSDDQRVYASGRRHREIMDRYADANPLAGKLWEKLCNWQLEQFMLGQLMPRVEDVVLNETAQTAMIGRLSDFLITYLCTTGRETMMAGSVRDAIAKKIGAPPSYVLARREERETQIDHWIMGYKSPTVEEGQCKGGSKEDLETSYYACPECGCTDVECTAWISVNSEQVSSGDAPTDNAWCPQCEYNGVESDMKSRHLVEVSKAKPIEYEKTEASL